jgi:hypothetical protein
MRTRLGRSQLDKQLAEGADPTGSPELSLRAAQLALPDERARIANALVETLGDARGREPVTIRARPQRAAVRDAADDILALVLRLRQDEPVDAVGVAIAAWLADDRSSPMHREGAGDLQEALRRARGALDSEQQPRTAEVEPRAA